MEYTTTTQRKEKFLEAFKKNGMILSACREAGISRTTCYRWMALDEVFKSKVANAYQEAYNDPSKKAVLESLPMHKRNHLCPTRVISTEAKESHYQPRRKKTPQEILGQAFNRGVAVYNKIAQSITDDDIESMTIEDKISALNKLSFILKVAKKLSPRELVFTRINTRTAGVQELENALLNINNEE